MTLNRQIRIWKKLSKKIKQILNWNLLWLGKNSTRRWQMLRWNLWRTLRALWWVRLKVTKVGIHKEVVAEQDQEARKALDQEAGVIRMQAWDKLINCPLRTTQIAASLWANKQAWVEAKLKYLWIQAAPLDLKMNHNQCR